MIVLCPQSPESHARDLAAMRCAARQLSSSPRRARAYLIKHGYITRDGKLTKRYS